MSSRPDRAADVAKPVRRPWRSSLVLVCRECDGVRGYGPKQVGKALKRAAKGELPRKAVRVAAVSCLDVCPKRAVAVAVAGVGETAVTVSGPGGVATVVERLGIALAEPSDVPPAVGSGTAADRRHHDGHAADRQDDGS